jgi:hypothetical protein
MSTKCGAATANLERQPRLHPALQVERHGLVESGQDLHRQLRVDALIADEVVECIGKRKTDTGSTNGHVSHMCYVRPPGAYKL